MLVVGFIEATDYPKFMKRFDGEKGYPVAVQVPQNVQTIFQEKFKLFSKWIFFCFWCVIDQKTTQINPRNIFSNVSLKNPKGYRTIWQFLDDFFLFDSNWI